MSQTAPTQDASPTFWQVARRPKWIAALLLALVVAGIFAWLGRWQLERSIDSSRATGPDTETVVALSEIAEPQQPVAALDIWRMVTVEVDHFVAGDELVLSGRTNDGDTVGYWLVQHAVTTDGASLAVAVGWSPTPEIAVVDIDHPVPWTLTGRYMPTEDPTAQDFEAGERKMLSVAELVNEWDSAPTVVYGGYLVLAEAWSPLVTIDSPPPRTDVEVNVLNLFYALEWVVFAGAAVFLWWRLVRDEQVVETGSS